MSKTASPKSQLTKEEQMLIQDYSRNVSVKSSALFYGNAAIVAAVPIWLFWRIHQMEPVDFYIYFILATFAAAYLISYSYQNVKFVLKHKVMQKRESAVAKEIANEKNDKKNKKEQEDRVLWKKNEVAEFEATTYSIFYNNSLFLLILLITSFLVFKNFQPLFNYLLSMGVAAGLVALFSTGTK
jgi:translocon-associated protein subunit gamma